MQRLDTILAEHPFFQGMLPDHMQLIAGCATMTRFSAGERIFSAGEAAEHFYLVRHGTVALEIIVPGRGYVPIQTVCESEILGWSWLFPPYRWHFDARALGLMRAFAFNGKCLREKCERDHDLGYELMKRFAQVMAHRLQATRLQLLDVYGILK
jgi:CRP/FNR family transcriptional regulator, cyclic AMP receptor protein